MTITRSIRIEQRFLVASFILFQLSANAQKLPSVQEKSLRAPAGIKIDGKAGEWNNQLQAFNKATEVFYTISNDNDKLYLTFQASDLDIINKIICQGITLTVNGSGKMKDQEGVAITYPAVNRKYFPWDDTPVNLSRRDLMQTASFIEEINKELSFKTRDIKISGINGIKDTISVYNREGIRAAALFDNKGVFTSELAVPLELLGLFSNVQQPFVYNIKVNGGLVLRKEMKIGITSLSVENGTVVFGGPTAEKIKGLYASTDFWAEYTLAK